MRPRALRSLAPAIAVLAAVTLPAGADPLREQAARRQAQCEAIDARQGQTGMVFNPPTLQTVHDRSACFQALAVDLREPGLCRLALERRSWFFDGSGVSPQACDALVAAQVEADRARARQLREQHVTAVAMVRNGNGRDYDVLVGASGGSAQPHRLTIVLADAAGVEHAVHADRQPLGRDPAQLRLLLRAGAVQQVLPAGASVVQVSARLALVAETLEQRAVLAHMPPSVEPPLRACVVLPQASSCRR